VRVTRRGGSVRLRLDQVERDLLRLLAAQVLGMLDDGAADPPAEGEAGSGDDLERMVGLTAGPEEAPSDPALHRLLPDAYADDAPAASEFRRLTDGGLRAAKVAALQRLLADLDTAGMLTLAPAEVEQWLQALNDVRLVIGVRLEVTEDDEERWAAVRPEDPEAALLFAYDRLTMLQQGLIEAVDPES
jgi:hypothetical protein